jgi:outer membrane lipase/esterase
VPVGITVQSNTGSSNGHNLSAAAQVGFAPGTCTRFGPLAGLAWQRVEVDGFTESGSFTRLGFGDQTRNSVVASVGLKATTHCGMFRPFAEVDYSWELASTDRDVAAFLITTTAPGYTMPAVLLDKSWGSATLGTNVILGPGLTGLVSASTNFGQGDVTTYGVQVGLNFAF